MTEWRRGAKAGAVSGLISGIIIGITFATWLAISASPEQFRMVAAPEADPEAAYLIYWGLIVGTIFSYSFFGPAVGTLLGLIFAATYMRLPAKTALIKGIVLGIAFWIVFFWILAPLALGGISYFTATNLFGSIPYGALLGLYGTLLGFFWNRFAPKKIFDSREKRPDWQR